MDLTETSTNDLLFLGFNQDYGCIACGTVSGFRIYNSDPFKETFRRALIGGGPTPRYPPHKVMIWDDHQDRCIGELSFRTRVRNVKLRRDRVVIALSRRVYVHNFADLTLLSKITTADNPKGLLAVSAGGKTVVACPHTQVGKVAVHHLDDRSTVYVSAHETPLACVALNLNGSRLATASERGTLIRIFDTESGEKLQELRRGTDRAMIHSLCFNPDCTFLACTSDKGTCHIFRLTPEVGDATAVESIRGGVAGASGPGDAAMVPGAVGTAEEAARAKRAADEEGDGKDGAPGDGTATTAAAGGGGDAGDDVERRAGGDAAGGEEDPGMFAGIVKGMLPSYFSSEWSYAQFRVPEGRSICAFGTDPGTVIVVTAEGLYFKANFAKGGEAVRLEYSPFLKATPAGPIAGVLPGTA